MWQGEADGWERQGTWHHLKRHVAGERNSTTAKAAGRSMTEHQQQIHQGQTTSGPASSVVKTSRRAGTAHPTPMPKDLPQAHKPVAAVMPAARCGSLHVRR